MARVQNSPSSPRKVVFRVPRSPQPPEPRSVFSRIPKFMSNPQNAMTAREAFGPSSPPKKMPKIPSANDVLPDNNGILQTPRNVSKDRTRTNVAVGPQKRKGILNSKPALKHVGGQVMNTESIRSTETIRKSQDAALTHRINGRSHINSDLLNVTGFGELPMDEFGVMNCPVEVSRAMPESYNDSFTSSPDVSIYASHVRKASNQQQENPVTMAITMDTQNTDSISSSPRKNRFPSSSLKGPHRSHQSSVTNQQTLLHHGQLGNKTQCHDTPTLKTLTPQMSPKLLTVETDEANTRSINTKENPYHKSAFDYYFSESKTLTNNAGEYVKDGYSNSGMSANENVASKNSELASNISEAKLNSERSGLNIMGSEDSEVFLEFALQCLTEMGMGDNLTSPQTPSSPREGSVSSINTEQTLHGLKKELERCLAMYRTKRLQVSSLQDDLQGTRTTLDEVSAKLDTAQKQASESQRRLAEYEAEVGPLGGPGVGEESVQERRLQRQVDSLTRDKRMLDEEVKELMARIEEIADDEERVKEANRELSHQMADMVREYDEDKRQALEHCESTLMQHHERVKAQLEADLRDELTQDSYSLTRQYEQQIAELKQELEGTQTELHEVKDMYISVCQAKDHIRESTDSIWTDKLEAQLAEVRSVLSKEKEEEIDKLKVTWASNNDVMLNSAKEKWLKEQEENMVTQLEEKIASSKVDWLKEHSAAKETAVKAALATAEQAWNEQWDTLLQQTLEEKLDEAQESWNKDNEDKIETEVVLRTQSLTSQPPRAETLPGLTEAELNRRVDEARQMWISEELPQALQEERDIMEADIERRVGDAQETWRQTELQQAINDIKVTMSQNNNSVDLKTKVADMLSEARESWLEEQQLQVDATVAEARKAAEDEAKRKVNEITAELQQEISELYSAKLSLEKELSTLQTTMSEERSELLTAKDSERREAVLATQDQCERDYREFLTEHQDTLNKALRSAREEFAREKAVIEQKHIEEIRGLREREVKASQLELHVAKEASDIEAKWQQNLDEMSKKHSEEKDLMMRSHRDNLLKALEEARSRWQQKYEEALEENSVAIIEEKDASWSEERSNLQGQIEEANVRAAQHQDNLATFKADMEEAHQQEVTQLKASQQNEMSAATAELRKQLDGRSAEMERLSGEVRECVAGLEEAQRVAQEEAQELRAAIGQRDAEIGRLKAELTASSEQVESSETVNVDVVRKLEGMQKQAERLEHEKKEAESQRELLISTFRNQHSELVEQLQRAERNLKTSDVTTQKQVALMQESLERESAVAMEKMKAKMVELRTNHLVAMETVRKQHTAEKRELKRQLEQQRREMAHTPTQTEGQTLDPSTLSDMGNQYLTTVTNMRSEVLRHVSDSNTRAAQTVREQIIKERHQTARRLRRYYMKCLNHLLDEGCQHLSREEKLAYMEQAMEYVPSRDTSQVTTTDTAGSRSNTPDADVMAMTRTGAMMTSAGTSTNNTPKSSTSSMSRSRLQSRDELSPRQRSEERRGPQKDTRVMDVIDSSLQTRVKALVASYTTPEGKTDGYKSDGHKSSSIRREDRYISTRSQRDAYNGTQSHHQREEMLEPREHISRSKHRNSSKPTVIVSETQSLDRHYTHSKRQGGSRTDIPRLDLTNVNNQGVQFDSTSPHSPNRVNSAHGNREGSASRRHHGNQNRAAYHSHSSWDSGASTSGDNTQPNGHHLSPERSSKDPRGSKRSHIRTSGNLSVTPSRQKYNLSSKSAEHFSIEKPRRSKSKQNNYTDVSYEMDIEMPSVVKSQSTTCLEHSTPRGQYLLDSEPRKYYDVDIRTFVDPNLQPVRDAACGGSTPLTKVNSETYLLTPSGLHGSMSMGDVREIDENDQSLSESKAVFYSDEGLLNCDPEMTPSGRGYHISNSSNRQMSGGPQKSMSMPNVARAENWVNNLRMRSYPEDYNNDGVQLDVEVDSGESTLSESINQTPYVTTRPSKLKQGITSSSSGGSQAYGSSHQQHRNNPYPQSDMLNGKREQYHVAFNVDTNRDDDEASDNESVKSFLSTSSVSDFRHALKSKQVPRSTASRNMSTQSVGASSSGVKKPLKVLPPSDQQLQSMLAQVPDNVHRPVAMVTRHTQMPSPKPVFKQVRGPYGK